MAHRRTRLASRDYKEAIRRQYDDKFVVCPHCKTKQPVNPNSDLYICEQCLKTFFTTALGKAVAKGFKHDSSESTK